jgi:hypothetical protein
VQSITEFRKASQPELARASNRYELPELITPLSKDYSKEISELLGRQT